MFATVWVCLVLTAPQVTSSALDAFVPTTSASGSRRVAAVNLLMITTPAWPKIPLETASLTPTKSVGDCVGNIYVARIAFDAPDAKIFVVANPNRFC